MLALIVAGIVLCFKTVTFYFKVLFRAEHYAEQAVCDECKTYGVIEVLAAALQEPQDLAAAIGDQWLEVRCKKCGHGWKMNGMQTAEPDGKYL
jgi:hypothetical protein